MYNANFVARQPKIEVALFAQSKKLTVTYII